MNTALHLAASPSSQRPDPAEEERDLAGLLELFGAAETAGTPVRQSLRSSLVRLRDWTQQTSRRAARWGAVARVAQ